MNGIDLNVEKRLVESEACKQKDFESRLLRITLENQKALEEERKFTKIEIFCVRLGALILLMLTILAMVLAKLSDVIHAVLALLRALRGE